MHRIFYFQVSSEDIVSVDCPSVLKNSYVSLSADENGTENACIDSYVTGCAKNTQVAISTSSSCQSNTYIPGSDTFLYT